MMRLLPLPALLLVAAPAAAQTLTVAGGKADRTNTVVTATLPAGVAGSVNVVELPGGRHAAAQITGPALLSDAKGKQINFVLPTLPAGGSVRVRPATLNYIKAPSHFRFVEHETQGTTDLVFDKRPVLRFVHPAHDASTPDRHDMTFKPFVHVFEPARGEYLLTGGAYPFSDKSKLYPHHRGLFYGWMRITYDGKQADTWHGRKGEFTEQGKALVREAGEVLGRYRAGVAWHGQDGKTFATEEREVTAYHVPGGTLIDFASVLKTDRPKVRLDGDPQHAGFHFRAAQEVAKDTKAQTYFLRPDGKGAMGQTRNWDAKTRDPKTVDLPWDAMSFVVHGKRYTVLRMDHQANPGEARGSERDYGRFGDYFEYELAPGKPLTVRYRVWVQEGEMTKEECEALHRAFVDPPVVTAAK
ncbi:MAG TPA: DUF6807 family protein [Fimbriiglobus sp.]|nr:DUF6807 family protein [Fimbriiglobus sp.]